MAEALFFYPVTIVMLAAAASVVLSRAPIYSVLSLLVVMLCLSFVFVMLGAFFLAALQVLLYAGAVVVLFLFVIMLLNLQREEIMRARIFTLRIAATFLAVILLARLLTLLRAPHIPLAATEHTPGTLESIARLLFTQYLLPFELASFLILAAIIGAVTLAKQKPNE